ncbi:MAG: hypothetical protein C0404_12385 [Verrucomicrobia bacterium]|nr:hypothetical protein [Verrucomicrobiota bacterium]
MQHRFQVLSGPETEPGAFPKRLSKVLWLAGNMKKNSYQSPVFGSLAVSIDRKYGPAKFSLEGIVPVVAGFRDVRVHITGKLDVPIDHTVAAAERVHGEYVKREPEIRRQGLNALLECEWMYKEDRKITAATLFPEFREIPVINYFVSSGEISIYYHFCGDVGGFSGHEMNIVMGFNLKIENVGLDG